MIKLKLLLESNSAIDEFRTTSLLQFIKQNASISESNKEKDFPIQPTKMKGLSDPEFDVMATDSARNRLGPFIHHKNIEPKTEKDIALVDDESKKTVPHEVYKKLITTRPPRILQRNTKMKHSGGGKANFFNVGLPAFRGLIVDERTGEFKVITTCIGAGKCSLYCYARNAASLYISLKESSLYQTRVLNFLINDPKGFEQQLTREIQTKLSTAEKEGKKLVVRWHDSGDFFSPDYEKFAYNIAEAFPNVKFFAYTKMAGMVHAKRPPNFFVRFSKGASAVQEKQIDFENTMFADIVPREVFQDLFYSKKKGAGLKKEEFIEVLKQRVSEYFKIDKRTILTYKEIMKIKETTTPIYNVIVMGGDGDDAALRYDVKAVYLLAH